MLKGDLKTVALHEEVEGNIKNVFFLVPVHSIVICSSAELCLFLQKLIPELQKLFMSKNEANVLKLWPLFVKLLGKVKHFYVAVIDLLNMLHVDE